MSAAQINALAEAAMARLALWIARSAAQHQRRMRESWRTP
jgi:hypothetical protein